ncbi:MAG: hypothetical protein IKZ51_08630 [Bacteroidales bacterium]|nr:hypothetical protein [Bacteroidales bacterium]
MKRISIAFILFTLILLSACSKERSGTGEKQPVITITVIVKNALSSKVSMTVYTKDYDYVTPIVKKLDLPSGQIYSYSEDLLEGGIAKDKINFRSLDSLDIAFSDGKTLRLRSGLYEKNDDLIFDKYWRQDPEDAVVGQDNATLTFSVDEHLASLAR